MFVNANLFYDTILIERCKMEEVNTIKSKRIIYLKRKPKQYVQLLFHILMVAAVSFLFVQNIHIKKELQESKANEFKLFNEVNKLEKDIYNLKVNIVVLEKIKLDKNTKTEKLQKKEIKKETDLLIRFFLIFYAHYNVTSYIISLF